MFTSYISIKRKLLKKLYKMGKHEQIDEQKAETTKHKTYTVCAI